MSKKIRRAHFTALIFAALIAAAALQGCASVTLAPPEEDAKAKVMQPAPDRALVYIYRDTFFGAAFTFTVTVDDFIVGPIRWDQYYVLSLAPKKTKLVVESENTAEFEQDLQAGHTYYFRLDPSMGLLRARVSISPISESTGKAALEDCKLIRVVTL